MHIGDKDSVQNRQLSHISDPRYPYLDRVVRHTMVYHSSSPTCKPNFVQIGKTICEWMDIWMDGY